MTLCLKPSRTQAVDGKPIPARYFTIKFVFLKWGKEHTSRGQGDAGEWKCNVMNVNDCKVETVWFLRLVHVLLLAVCEKEDWFPSFVKDQTTQNHRLTYNRSRSWGSCIPDVPGILEKNKISSITATCVVLNRFRDFSHKLQSCRQLLQQK